MKKNVLIGFEESQASCIAFRKLGHNAFSCDLKKCSGGKPEWHLQMDIFQAIRLKKWDLIILHPPCTYTALCGNRWYWNSPLRLEGIDLCKRSWESACAVCDSVVLEQPIMICQMLLVFMRSSNSLTDNGYGYDQWRITSTKLSK